MFKFDRRDQGTWKLFIFNLKLIEITKIDQQETKENSERVHIAPGFLRVKKEEELQETPPGGVGGGGGGNHQPIRPTSTPLLLVSSNNGPTSESRCVSTPPVPKTTTILIGRGPSPPPEDWKPLDKCCFCLDGKLQNEDQAPLVSIKLFTRFIIFIIYERLTVNIT